MSSDSMGVTREKPTPKLFSVSLSHYEDAVGWVRRYLNERGYPVARAVLDPYVEVWFFYDYEGGLVLTLDHSSLDIVMEYLVHAIQKSGATTLSLCQAPGYRPSLVKGVEGLWRLDREPPGEKR